MKKNNDSCSMSFKQFDIDNNLEVVIKTNYNGLYQERSIVYDKDQINDLVTHLTKQLRSIKEPVECIELFKNRLIKELKIIS